MKKLKRWFMKLVPARRVRLVVVRVGSDALEDLLAQGPESPVWRGMDEVAWRLMQRWEDEASGSLEEKGLAVVRNQALMELRQEMMTVFYARQKKVAAERR
jgi:hypothetical protein